MEQSEIVDNISLSIGGGKINEKERNQQDSSDGTYTPDSKLGHLLHSIVGLDRYPNYLSRWCSNMEDITELEKALEQTLQKVQYQKNLLKQQQEIIQNSIPTTDIDGLLKEPTSWQELSNILHPKAYNAILNSKSIQKILKKTNSLPSMQKIIHGGCFDIKYDESTLAKWMYQEQELPNYVYSFPIFSNEFCQTLISFFHRITSSKETQANMLVSSRPIDLDMMGLSWINDLLLHLIIQPILSSTILPFPRQTTALESKNIKLDWRQGYVTGYSNVPSKSTGSIRNNLVSHTDDSEITLNICLGSQSFQGGNLIFGGMRSVDQEMENEECYVPIVGNGVIHSGRHLHSVSPVTDGNRYVLIVWARAWRDVRGVTCPCCWLNNRDDGCCICDWRWN